MVLQGTEWQPSVHRHYTCGIFFIWFYECVYVWICLIYSPYFFCFFPFTWIWIYIYIYIYEYMCMYFTHIWAFVFLTVSILFPLHIPPCSSSQACATMSLAPGLYLHGGAWMDGTWEPFSMTRCISYTWGLWGISMQVRWDIGFEMVTTRMGRCLRSWGPFPKTWKINPAEKGYLVRFNVIIFGWVPLSIFMWEAFQIDVWRNLQTNVCGIL